MGFFGQRFSRASASERRRRSRSAAVSVFGTPLARRPRADAAADGLDIANPHVYSDLSVVRQARYGRCGRSGHLVQMATAGRMLLGRACGVTVPTRAGRSTPLHRCLIVLDIHPAQLAHVAIMSSREYLDHRPTLSFRRRRYVRTDRHALHLLRPFRGVSHLHEDTVTDNRFTVKGRNASISTFFQGALLPNAEAHGRAVARTVQPLVGLSESGTE